MSKTLMHVQLTERSYHKEINVKYKTESPIYNGSHFEAQKMLKFSEMWVKGHDQGHKLKNFGMNKKA